MNDDIARETLRDVLNQEFKDAVDARVDALEERAIETIRRFSERPSIVDQLHYLNDRVDWPNPDVGKVIERLIDNVNVNGIVSNALVKHDDIDRVAYRVFAYLNLYCKHSYTLGDIYEICKLEMIENIARVLSHNVEDFNMCHFIEVVGNNPGTISHGD